MNIHLDYETRSRADLQDVGAYRYANDPSTEILCAAIAEGDNEPVIWRCDQAMTQEVIDLLLLMTRNPNALVYAHNAQFEAAISDALFEKTFGVFPPAHSKWRCTAAMGRRAALPASLKNLAEFLQLKNQKDSKGMELIRKFSIPQKSTGEFIQPEDDAEAFQQFCDYCLQDVRVEQEIHKKIDFFSSKSAEQVFALDMAINSRGFPVNLDALRKADILVDTETERLGKIFTELTGLKHTQRERFMGWLKERGFKPDNLQSATLDEVLADEAFEEDTELGKALKIKKLISFASLAKIKSMLACAGPHDNRVRGTLTYHGAGTGRWSASLVQPQNFKRPAAFMESLSEQAYKDICDGCSSEWLELVYGPPLEVISSCIRHFIQNDSPMLDVDYSSIEARIIAWQAGEQWRLDVFNTHGRIYEASASTMFNVPLSEFDDYRKKNGKHHPLRQKGKVAELALAYRGGVGAMVKMGAIKQGLIEEELPEIVKAWREASPKIVGLWKQCETAAKSAIKFPTREFTFGVGCSFYTKKISGERFLFMSLPSKRLIAYPRPDIKQQLVWQEVKKIKTPEGVKTEKGDWKKILTPTESQVQKIMAIYPEARITDVITFHGKIPNSAHWGSISTHGGVFVENCIQGIAADFMAHGAINAESKGYEIVALIHDEALAHYYPEKGQSLEEFTELLVALPEWAEGMPLAADGDIVKFYKK